MHLHEYTFEKELRGNDVVKGMLDGKCKLKTVCETRCIRANALTILKATFPVVVGIPDMFAVSSYPSALILSINMSQD
jgi:hypothetical protein